MYGPLFLILGPIMKIIVFCTNIISVASILVMEYPLHVHKSAWNSEAGQLVFYISEVYLHNNYQLEG